ncbi:hypothetical protein GCM10027417_23330 [Glutamicibacter endophyticus]
MGGAVRKIISVIAMLLGVAALIVGIGQKTFWAPPETVTASMPQFSDEAPLTVIEPTINDAHLAPVELVIKGEGEFTASLARSAEVQAWVDDAAHVTLEGIDRANASLQADYTDGKKEVPNPAGDDIFFDSQKADGTMTYRWTAPDDGQWSLLLAADGKKPAPVDISITYDNDDAMPWALPLIIIGALLLVLGAALLAVRGNTKKTPAKSPAQFSVALAAVLALGTGAVSLPMSPTESSKESEPATSDEAKASETAKESEQKSEQATESESSKDAASTDAESLAYPVVTEEQLTRLLKDVQKQIGAADDKHDSDRLGWRAAGAFKSIRDTRYKILKDKIKGAEKLIPVETSVVRSAAVPNASEVKFPRRITVVTAKDQDANTLPTALTLQQDNARANYKVVFAAKMLPNSTFPGIAVGDPSVKQLEADAEGLKATPKDAAKALAKVMGDEKAKEKDQFEKSALLEQLHAKQKDEDKNRDEAKIERKTSVNEKDTSVISTPDGGALVTARINEKVTFSRGEDADVLDVVNDLTKALLGSSTSNKAVEVNYATPVMFYIPAADSDQKISLIAGEVTLLGAKQADD